MCLNWFARSHGLEFTHRQANAHVARGRVNGVDVVLAKPTTYMNQSGAAVAGLVQRWHIALPDLLVVYDDMDLPMGRVRLRPKGSAGGHHGMESIIAGLGSQEFPRLRVGIGRPEGERGGIDYVLGRFSSTEMETLDDVLAKVSQALDSFLLEGLDKAMSKFNRDGAATEAPDQ